MKTYFIILVVFGFFAACARKEGEYLDLRSNEKVQLEADKETGYMVNVESRKPVYLYVDSDKRDTFYGRTGKKINGMVSKRDGEWMYDGDDDYVYKNGDYKVKIEGDGDYKEKDGDYKKKVDEDGDVKIKNGDDNKVKIEKDGDMKIKNGDTKIKIEDGKRKVKVDD